MRSDVEIQARANTIAKYATSAIDVDPQPFTEEQRGRVEREIAIAFTVGYAAGAEDQAGVIRNRPVRERGTRG